MKMAKVSTVIFMVFLICGAAFSQKGTAITIGGSYWRGGIDFDLGNQETLSKSSNMIGPYLNIRMNRITVGGSMFFGTYDFDEDMQELTGDADASDKLKRNDVNVSVGFSITRRISLFGAYKSVKWAEEYEYYDAWSGQTFKDDWEETGTFAGGGLSVTSPFGRSPLFFFGSAAYLAATNDDWNDILSTTVGLGFYDKSGISIMAGYRFDSFLSENDDVDDLEVKGIVATIAYTIRSR